MSPMPTSDDLAEDSVSAGEPSRESPGGVLRMGCGLVVIVGALLFALLPQSSEADPQARLAECFELVGPVPFGFQPTRAILFGTGQEFILMGRGSGDGEIDSAPDWLPPQSKGWGSYKGEAKSVETFDWSSVEVDNGPNDPMEVAIGLFSGAKGSRAIQSQFAGVKYEDITRLPKNGQAVPVDSGRIRWGPYEAPFVLMRHFGRDADGPGFWDTLRVNLSVGSRLRVLYLRWGRGQAGGVEHANAFLRIFDPGQ